MPTAVLRGGLFHARYRPATIHVDARPAQKGQLFDYRSDWDCTKTTTDSYRATLGKFVQFLSKDGRIEIENFTSLEPFEIQERALVSSTGKMFILRNADTH